MDLNNVVQRVLGGDLEAFAGVIESYQVGVGNFVSMTFPVAQKVEEVVQEIFIRAFRQLPAYEQDQPFWPWLRGIARNVVYEELRREQKAARERLALAELALLREAERAAKEHEEREGADREDALGALRECLGEHAEEGSRLLKWFYAEGLSSDTIAERMGCGGSAVRNALTRIRRSLKDCVRRRLATQSA